MNLFMVVMGLIGVAQTAVLMPSTFGNNMVLQTNLEYGTRAFLYGRADAQEKINVTVNSYRGTDNYLVAANENGDWRLTLNPERPEIGVEITVEGETGIKWKAVNVSYGDVYLCAGQSNMEFPMKDAFNATEEIASMSNFTQFRLFKVDHHSAPTEEFDVRGKWEVITPERLAEFSAVCYMTVREISRLHTGNWSMGLIQSTWGDSRIESWMPPEAIEECTDEPQPGDSDHNEASAIWNGMIAPFTPISIRTVLWYQGESNAAGKNSTDYYACMFQSMIRGWRKRFGIGDFAFNFVQLAPSVGAHESSEKKENSGVIEIRAAQAQALPRTDGQIDISGMAVAIDLGGESVHGFQHPPDKSKVAHRLALVTLHTAFGLQEQWNGTNRFAPPIPIEAIRYSSKNVTMIFEEYSSHDLVFVSTPNCSTCCFISPFEALNTKSDSWEPVIPEVYGHTLYFNIPEHHSEIRYAWSDFVECALTNNDTLVAAPLWMNITDPPSNTSTLEQITPVQTPVSLKKKTKPIEKPPMGFNSWNYYHCNIDEQLVLDVAQAMRDRGLHKVGYEYINLDDCWQVARRENGTIVEDPVRFPSGMKKLASDLEQLGFKFGLYTARGWGTCQYRPGSLGHEVIDAATYCDWGVHYLKLDGCAGAEDGKTSWTLFHDAFEKCYNDTGRYIVFSVESCGHPDPAGCAGYVAELANLWRTGGDIQATYTSMMENIKVNDPMALIASPGHFNDPDLLQIGNAGMSLAEQRTQFALWCITSAPLLISTDIVNATKETIEILTTKPLIEINQDLGLNGAIQGVMLQLLSNNQSIDNMPFANSTSSTWVKHLADGKSIAVAVVNEALFDQKLTVQWEELGIIPSHKYNVTDLWTGKSLGTLSHQYTEVVKSHDTLAIKLTTPNQ